MNSKKSKMASKPYIISTLMFSGHNYCLNKYSLNPHVRFFFSYLYDSLLLKGTLKYF